MYFLYRYSNAVKSQYIHIDTHTFFVRLKWKILFLKCTKLQIHGTTCAVNQAAVAMAICTLHRMSGETGEGTAHTHTHTHTHTLPEAGLRERWGIFL